MFQLFQVKGTSMLPNFKPKQYVLSFATSNIKKDDVIVFKDKKDDKFIKRVSWLQNKKFKVQSDNNSYPSDVLDRSLEIKNIIGKVIYKF
jgi:phage repressor protein C with HTH and peptisase S24 domain